MNSQACLRLWFYYRYWIRITINKLFHCFFHSSDTKCYLAWAFSNWYICSYWTITSWNSTKGRRRSGITKLNFRNRAIKATNRTKYGLNIPYYISSRCSCVWQLIGCTCTFAPVLISASRSRNSRILNWF
mgnify:CR=1 FL=1